jgi:hypothetical protein
MDVPPAFFNHVTTMIKIPVSYVPRARVDFDAEAHQILGHDFVMSDGFRVPPLTAGRLVALELVSSPFFLRPFECDALDAAAAIVLLTCDRALIEDFTASVAGSPSCEASDEPSAARNAQTTSSVEGLPSGLHSPSATYPKLYDIAASWLQAHGIAMLDRYPALVEWILDVPFYGLAMLPRGAACPREFWFDGSFVGGVVAAAAKILATPVDAVMWETPFCLVGHAVAQHAAACGVKGVERPPDEAVLKDMMRQAAEREAAGQLHPWQFQDPVSYSLTDTQANANPALIGIFAAMRAEFERNGHKPLDPAAFPVPPVESTEESA